MQSLKGLSIFYVFVKLSYIDTTVFLNQAHAWFLKIDSVRIVGMRVCVCVSVSEAINN